MDNAPSNFGRMHPQGNDRPAVGTGGLVFARRAKCVLVEALSRNYGCGGPVVYREGSGRSGKICESDGGISNMKKVLPLILVLLGTALLIPSVVFWVDSSTSTEPQSFGKTLLDWVVLIAGLGASIKGWVDLFKKERSKPPTIKIDSREANPQISTGDHIRNVQTQVYIENQTINHLPEQELQETDESPKYSVYIYGNAEGVVVGDNNVTSFYLPGNKKNEIVFLAPPLPSHELVGRSSVINTIKEKLIKGDSVSVTALNGMPGIGKTAIAIFIAHNKDVLEKFTDGVLWASLGRDPNLLSILTMWGDALGLDEYRRTKLREIEDWAKEIQSLIVGRRFLIVIDDAWNAQDALLFKIGNQNCAHLLTTRHHQIAVDFANESTLIDELDAANSLFLFQQFATDFIVEQPDLAQKIINEVGGLPLSIKLIGNYVSRYTYGSSTRRQNVLSNILIAQKRLLIAQSQERLTQHPSLKPHEKISLDTIISISYDALENSAKFTLDKFSVFLPKPNTFSEQAMLKIADATATDIDILTDVGLIESYYGEDRFTIHQAISDYIQTRNSAIEYKKYIVYYLELTQNIRQDYKLLDKEINNILDAMNLAFLRQFEVKILIDTVNDLYEYFEYRGNYETIRKLLEKCLEIKDLPIDAERNALTLYNLSQTLFGTGDYKTAQSFLKDGIENPLFSMNSGVGKLPDLYHLQGKISGKLGEYKAAKEYLEKGLSIARRKLDYKSQIKILLDLGVMSQRSEVSSIADKYFTDALDVAKKLGNLEKLANCYQHLGASAITQGMYDIARQYFLDGLRTSIESQHNERIILAYAHLGWYYREQQDYAKAIENYKLGLNLAVNTNHREGIGFILFHLGGLENKRKEYRRSQEYLEEGLKVAEYMQYSWLQSCLLNELGEVCFQQARLVQAEDCFRKASGLADDVQSAKAYFGLARIANLRDENLTASEFAKKSLEILESYGHSKAGFVKKWLDAVNRKMDNHENSIGN